MGAQAAGYVGHFTGGRVGRITGLDPSGPLFYSVTDDDRLDRSCSLMTSSVTITHPTGYYDNWQLMPTPYNHKILVFKNLCEKLCFLKYFIFYHCLNWWLDSRQPKKAKKVMTSLLNSPLDLMQSLLTSSTLPGTGWAAAWHQVMWTSGPMLVWLLNLAAGAENL